jgi:hypothetical protein
LGARRTYRTLGDPDTDEQLDRAIKVAARILSVNPAFTFFEPDRFIGESELEGMQAFAKSANVLPGTRGLVGFGIGRFRTELYGYDQTGTTVMGIVAHEFGHIVQMELG